MQATQFDRKVANPAPDATIKEICDKAELSRQTFYQMFDGKEEVATHAVHCHIHLPSLCEQADFATPEWLKTVTLQLAHAVRENKDLILLYRKNNLQYLLYEEISKAVSRIESKMCCSTSLHNEPLVNAFFTGAFAHSLLFLVEHDEISDEEFSVFFCNALKGKFFPT